jgi:hypothetical protein
LRTLANLGGICGGQVSADRAYLYFSVTDPGITVDLQAVVSPKLEGKLTYAFSNMGRTPATLLEERIITSIRARRDGFPPTIGPDTPRMGVRSVFPVGVVVAAGDKYELSINTFLEAMGPDWDSFADNSGNRSDLFLIGYVRYGDVFGIKYLKGFCALFDIYSDRFVLMGGEKYNYERVETS